MPDRIRMGAGLTEVPGDYVRINSGRLLTTQLTRALETRVIIEQAKGIVAENLKTSMDRAFTLLRVHARSESLRLTDVARAITEGRLAVTALTAPHTTSAP